LSIISERDRRPDLIDDDFDPLFGTAPEFSYLTDRRRLAALLHRFGVRLGERQLHTLSALVFLAEEEILEAEAESPEAFKRRFLGVGGKYDLD
jgi:hypothetical protein